MITFICFFCSVVYIVLIVYFIIGWTGLKSPQAVNGEGRTRISVIVPIRNEEDTIDACIHSIIDQTYPQALYEIIVVDDYSTDASIKGLRSLNDERIRILQLQEIYGDQLRLTANKKKAIEAAVSVARGDLIVVTDGDCRVPDTWLEAISAYYEESDCKFIAGPVQFRKSTSLLEAFQELDLVSMIGIAAATIHHRNGVMCNGANMAFEKNAFLQIDGYSGSPALPTGDDIFLMHKIAREFPGSVGFMKARSTIVETLPEPDLNALINQRKRWISKSMHYGNPFISGVLVFAYLYNFFILLLLILTMFNAQTYAIPLLACFAPKLLIDGIFLYLVLRFFNRMKLLFLFPAVQLLHITYVVLIGIWGIFGDYTWKGRIVKNSIINTQNKGSI